MVVFVFTKQAEKVFSKLSKSIQKRIVAKLKELKAHDDIFSILKRLNNFEPATHRAGIGQYRLILELRIQKGDYLEFWILDVGDGKDIYR